MANVDAVTAAIIGLSVLLVTGVVTWKECLAESVAWDTLTWFAALIAMAGYLNKYGLISWFSQTVVQVTTYSYYYSLRFVPFGLYIMQTDQMERDGGSPFSCLGFGVQGAFNSYFIAFEEKN